jgi:membrane dipeptidase
MFSRREMLAAIGTGAAVRALGGTAAASAAAQGTTRTAIDGLGEIHLDYPDTLLDEMRAAGMRGCVITLGNPALQGHTARDSVATELAAYDAHIRADSERFIKVLSVSDLDAAIARGQIGLIYYLQNSTPLGDDIASLDGLRASGVRIIQLTYNARNLVGDGCLERTNSGLSRFGLDLVAAMNEKRMLVDLSHCGEATTREGIESSKAPVAITHAGCTSVHDHPRNKADNLLKALADRGGVIGIFQINPYLGPRERNTLDDYLAHIGHALKVAGEDHVAVGSDREHRAIPDTAEEKQKLIDELSRLRPVTASGFRWPFFISELNHPRRMETIALALERRYTPRQVDKIIGGNWHRLLKETIG